MGKMSPALGQVWKVGARQGQGELYRVMGVDSVEVLFDRCWSDGTWSFGLSKRKCYYYRDRIERFVHANEYLETRELSAEEGALFRPDLPIRLWRRPGLSWTDWDPMDRPRFQAAVSDAGLLAELEKPLAVPEVVLLASRLKASTRGVVCRAEDGRAFQATELLWHAHRIQRERGKNWLPGIGLFRMGHEKGGLPSYLIGGFAEIPSNDAEYNMYVVEPTLRKFGRHESRES